MKVLEQGGLKSSLEVLFYYDRFRSDAVFHHPVSLKYQFVAVDVRVREKEE